MEPNRSGRGGGGGPRGPTPLLSPRFAVHLVTFESIARSGRARVKTNLFLSLLKSYCQVGRSGGGRGQWSGALSQPDDRRTLTVQFRARAALATEHEEHSRAKQRLIRLGAVSDCRQSCPIWRNAASRGRWCGACVDESLDDNTHHHNHSIYQALPTPPPQNTAEAIAEAPFLSPTTTPPPHTSDENNSRSAAQITI
uniref:Uncharacterized protein n=1 Tax=Plectus sambesii TaxID=2011161 RepID=A0A914W3K9_9BILA